MLRGRVARRVFPPDAIQAVQQLACVAPSVMGYSMTSWSVRALSTVVEDVVGEAVHFTTVAVMLRQVDINLQQMEYCKTATWDDDAIERALRVLWTYEHVDMLRERGEVVECLDEQPNVQVLGRKHEAWAGSSRRRRQEFEYKRHGTVNLLHGHRVHDGLHTVHVLPRNNGARFRAHILRRAWELQRAGVRRVHWILDNGPSHRAAETQQLFHDLRGFARVLFIPAHSSWLNQAELSIGAFARRYEHHAAWPTRRERIAALPRQVAEFNRLFARRFNWTYTRADFIRSLEHRAKVKGMFHA